MWNWHVNDPIWEVKRYVAYDIEHNETREWLYAQVPGQTEYTKENGTYNVIPNE
jgi:hypothetical protein